MPSLRPKFIRYIVDLAAPVKVRLNGYYHVIAWADVGGGGNVYIGGAGAEHFATPYYDAGAATTVRPGRIEFPGLYDANGVPIRYDEEITVNVQFAAFSFILETIDYDPGPATAPGAFPRL